MPTEAEIRESAGSVVDPELGQPLSQLKMLGEIHADGEQVRIGVELPTPAYPQPERLVEAVRSQVCASFPEVSDLEVDLSSVVKGKNSGGKVGMRVKNVIAVGSGKGGVGKSTIAASLAYGLKHFGANVGLLDADVYGPSIPHLIGASGQPGVVERQGPDGQVYQRIEPIEVDGIKLMSMGFMVQEDQAVIWRGPMLHKALQQFFQQTEWGELDYLIVDMPPGTGDVALTLSQLVSVAGAVVVCTPQKVALLDAAKAISMFGTVKIPILGIVENMTGDVFGRGGAKAKAEEVGAPFLGEVPSDPQIRISGDEGQVSALFAEDNATRRSLLDVTSRCAMEIVKQIASGPALPQLEIL